MIRQISFTQTALDDLERPESFLIGTTAAVKASEAIVSGIESLTTLSDRGHPGPLGLRVLQIPFGGGYVVQYQVAEDRILVARIFHSLEDRPLA